MKYTVLPLLHAGHVLGQVLTGYQTQCKHDASVAFDDGPYIYETALVNELQSYGVNSTLFVNGYNYGCIYDQSEVDSLRLAYESGFSIGSHTWNHYDIATGTTEQLGAQLDLVETALLKILGIKPALFRPPYGSTTDELNTYLNSRGYTVVGWSEGGDTGDSVGASVADQITVASGTSQLSIVLAHETLQATVEQVMPATVPGLVSGGLKLLTIDQCLDIQPYQAAPVAYGTRDETWTCAGTPVPGSGDV